MVEIPLVLHGTSGVPDEAVNQVLGEKPDTIDPKKYNAQDREEVKKYVMSKMEVCGSVGKA